MLKQTHSFWGIFSFKYCKKLERHIFDFLSLLSLISEIWPRTCAKRGELINCLRGSSSEGGGYTTWYSKTDDISGKGKSYCREK